MEQQATANVSVLDLLIEFALLLVKCHKMSKSLKTAVPQQV
jgi:hypothetical protein